MEWVKIKNKIDSRKFDRGEDDTHNHRKYETIKAVTKNSYGPLIWIWILYKYLSSWFLEKIKRKTSIVLDND